MESRSGSNPPRPFLFATPCAHVQPAPWVPPTPRLQQPPQGVNSPDQTREVSQMNIQGQEPPSLVPSTSNGSLAPKAPFPHHLCHLPMPSLLSPLPRWPSHPPCWAFCTLCISPLLSQLLSYPPSSCNLRGTQD